MKTKLFTLLSLLIASCLAFYACGGSDNSIKEELLTEEQKTAEKNAIVKTLETYNEAARERNWAKMVTTLDEEVTFFGTDSGEVSKNFDEFKNTMQKQWEEYETFEYGEIQDLYVQLDDYARYGNVIFGIPLTYGKKGETPEKLFLIFQRTLKKDPIQKKWVITSGILAVPRAQQ